jgi:inner membrane protein
MAALTTLYGYVFFLIQLKDYALLFGSIGLFLIVAVIMYYSRRIDWYGVHKIENGEKA